MRESTALVKVPLYKENEEKAGIQRRVAGHARRLQRVCSLNQTFTNTDAVRRLGQVLAGCEVPQGAEHGHQPRRNHRDRSTYGYAALPLEDVGEAAAKYDVDGANKLLDEIGLTNKDADGLRLGSDGKPLTILFEHGAHAPDLALIAEIVGEDLKKVGINVQVKKIDTTLWGTRRGANDLMSTMFWSHDQAGRWHRFERGRSTRLVARGHQYNNSSGASGVEPPDWMKEGFDTHAKWWTAVPGSAEWIKVSPKMLCLAAREPPYITIVEDVKYPMVVSKKLGNVAEGGFAIGLNFAGEQLVLNDKRMVRIRLSVTVSKQTQ